MSAHGLVAEPGFGEGLELLPELSGVDLKTALGTGQDLAGKYLLQAVAQQALATTAGHEGVAIKRGELFSEGLIDEGYAHL